ncbi:restriction endonuclease subunit S [Empedobacter brevis]
MNKDKKRIPQLRFPEFKNEGEWDNEELGKISEIVRGGSPRPIQDYLTTNRDGLNWLKIADVAPDSKYITETKEKVIKEALGSTREVNSGDLILSNSMSFGRPYILKIKTCIHDGWIAIRKISNKTFEDFLYYFISSESSQSYFNVNAAGAAVKNLNADIIKLLPIHFPRNKKEQQKIASCLSSLDEVIAAHNQKLELLKEHKKGLMQNLFPQKGSKIPKYRFKEFENDGEWVNKILESLTDRIGDGIHTTPKYDESGEFYFINGNNLVNSKIVIDDKTKRVSTSEFEIHKKDLTKETILLSINGTIGNVAFYNNEKVVLGKSACYLIPARELNNVFLYYSLQSPKISGYFTSELTGSTIKNLSLKSIRETVINVPSDKEQQKIASCLSTLDELITAQAEKIEQLKQHKKGLMQGLFPKMND